MEKTIFTLLLLTCTVQVFSQSNPPCANSVILNGAESATADYESSNWIQSDQIINPSATVDYSAADSICINANFEVILGAVFHAYIDPNSCLGSSNSPCGTDGAMFSGSEGTFDYEGELCFDGNEVTVQIYFPSSVPTGVLIFVPSGTGPPPGYGMTQVSPGLFTRTFTGYTVGQTFDISYLVIQDSGGAPPQYQTGAFSETLIVGCSDGSINSLFINAGADQTIFAGNTTQLNATVNGAYGIVTYEWSPSTGLSDPFIANPIANPTTTTTYTLTVYDGNTCTGTDEVTVNVSTDSACLVQVGSGGYTTDLPAGQIGPSDDTNNPIARLFTSNLQAPYPTTDWWSSLAFPSISTQVHSFNMFPRPLCVRAEAEGLQVGYPTEAVGTATYFYNYTEDLKIATINLNATETKVSDYSDWTVTADWSDGTLQATFGHGLPYVFCKKNTTDNALLTFNGTPTVFHDAGNYLGVSINGKNYGIFAPQGASWTQSSNAFESNLDNKDYFSVAILPDNSIATLQKYANHAFAFVTDTQVSWVYNEATASLTTTFAFTTTPQEGTETQTLCALFPHQWKHSSDALTSYQYNSGKGLLKVREGLSFQTTLQNKGMLPYMPSLAGATQNTFLYNEIDALYTNFNFGAAGTYWHGKELNMIAQLLPIAEQVGHTNAFDHWLTLLKADMESWFSTFCDGQTPLFYYDDTVGSLIGFPADFAMNSRMDDHHFHYGYFVMAAAIVAQYDQQWASDWGPMVELLIRDVANEDRNSSLFPFLRCMDPYAGHSWASGWSPFADGNNQESTSEAINFAAAVLKWGEETCNSTLTDLGAYLYLTESTSAHEYWFDVDNTNLPSTFPQEYVALVWGAKADYATWFSGAPEHIHGINYLPITGYSLHLGYDPAYAAANFAEMETSKGSPVTLWIDVLWNYLALSDAATPLAAFNASYPYSGGEDGESPIHTYHWLNNLDVMGTVDASIQADISHFAVFDKGGTKTYVAYNPACKAPRTVTFSDGTTFSINSGELKIVP